MSKVEKLFRKIRDNHYWKPDENIDYSDYNICDLKRMADELFDKLQSRGYFFHDSNEVLERTEMLRKYKNKILNKDKDENC